MLNKKKYLFTAVIIVLSLLFIVTAIQAQGYWNRGYDYDDIGWWNNNIPNQYSYSSEQMNEMNKIRSKYDQEIVPLQNKLRDQRIALRDLRNSSNYDTDKASEYRKNIQDIENQIYDYRIDARKDMSALLTDVQKQYFNSSSTGYWNNFYDRCGWDYDNMSYDYGNNRDNRMMNGRMGRGCW
ncbi:hypothetical protein MNBD_IGNAVI01-3054 [hydrothermal vent metagenome]|uniref:Zinc resistance-associated protein n=1 Tax=hydrothermal vent metagenome TaxID=652676 RepID=A0A3B1CBK3_9ZZZZ